MEKLRILTKLLFTVIPPPSINFFRPSQGAWGAVVNITDTNFDNVFDVRIGESVSFTIDSPTQISAIIPYASSGDHEIEVESAAGVATSVGSFTIMDEFGGGS